MSKPPLVFIAHPVRGDVSGNIVRASIWVRWAITEANVLAIAPYVGCLIALDDNDPKERSKGQYISNLVLSQCDELWLCGPKITKGMEDEISLAHHHGIPVVDLTGQEEP